LSHTTVNSATMGTLPPHLHVLIWTDRRWLLLGRNYSQFTYGQHLLTGCQLMQMLPGVRVEWT